MRDSRLPGASDSARGALSRGTIEQPAARLDRFRSVPSSESALVLAAFLLSLLPCAAVGGVFHAPHDCVYSVASAKLPSGLYCTVAVGTESAVLFTLDDGLTWEMLAGDGLELEIPWEVVYHPGLPAAGGLGLFVIATERGTWTWDPVADVVAEHSTGLAAGDRHLLDIEAPLAGSDGPVVGLSDKGSVYLLPPGTMTWQKVFDVGPVFARRGDVALTPHFDSLSAAPRTRDIYVAANGRLWISRDGGGLFQPQPNFTQTATQFTDWMISTVALSEDYHNDSIAMVGRVRLDPGFGSDRGDLWRTGTAGASFVPIRQLGSGVMSLACTPPGPGGARTWMIAGRSFPNLGNYVGTGILLSTDTGWTWDDWGNDQDFLLEDNPGKKSGYAPLNFEQELTVLPDYATRGAVMYGRQEGLFVSLDEGRHFVQRQMRVERECRDVRTAKTPDGQNAVFGAGYGTGTLIHVPAVGFVDELPIEPQMVYTRRLDVSPNFRYDGNVIVAGNVTLWCWQSDRVPAANPFNKVDWWQPSNRDPFSGQKLTGFPREVKYSPHFDGRGTPGSDQTFFWSSWDYGPYRSEDNGQTASALHQTATGGVAGMMSCFAIAPTYDAAGTRTDAYCGDEKGRLFRLTNEKWKELVDLGPMVEDMAIPSNWSRPASPVLYAALAGLPYVVSVRDDGSTPTVTSLNAGLPEVDVNGIAAHPDFANFPQLFITTFGSGVWKLDLAAPSPVWAPVGTGFPRLWARDVDLSPDFATDRTLYAATQNGIWACRDLPGESWRYLTTRGTRDDVDESFQFYAPNDPLNLNYDNAWPWGEYKAWNLPANLNVFGETMQFTTYDQSFVTTFATCRTLEVLTTAGPQMGTMLVRAVHPDTEVLIKAVTVDLAGASATNKTYRVPMDLGSYRRVKIYVSAQLDPAEMMTFDGIVFRD